MLRHIGERDAADRVDAAVRAVIAEGRLVTYDLGGDTGTAGFADAVIDRMTSRTPARPARAAVS
jgi:isocitrate dehydrogenase (NAD+)